MSNCIQLENPEVHFTEEEIDVISLRVLVERVAMLPDAPENDMNGYLAWWFLSQNYALVDNGFTVQFGQGRSCHTQRDFKQTCLLLGRFMKKRKEVTFGLWDEYDGFKELFSHVVVFESEKEIANA